MCKVKDLLGVQGRSCWLGGWQGLLTHRSHRAILPVLKRASLRHRPSFLSVGTTRVRLEASRNIKAIKSQTGVLKVGVLDRNDPANVEIVRTPQTRSESRSGRPVPERRYHGNGATVPLRTFDLVAARPQPFVRK